MDSFELKEIVNNLLDKENIDLTGFAAKVKADRSYLSKLVNSTKRLMVGPKILEKLLKAYPSYFDKNNTNNALPRPLNKDEPTAMQILSVLTNTINNQTEAYREHTAALKVQAELMAAIRNEMAQELTQAKIAEKVKALEDKTKEIDTNLIRTLAGVEKISLDQDDDRKEMRTHFQKLQVGKTSPFRGDGKKSGRIDGGVQKPGKTR